MKILFTQETDWLRRNPVQQHHLAEMLSLRGHKIRVIDHELQWRLGAERRSHLKREIYNDISKIYNGARVMVIRPGIIKMPCLDYVSLVFSHKKEIQWQIKEFEPDIIVGFGILNSYLATSAVRKNYTPFIYYWIDVLHRLIPTRILQPIGVLVERMALKQSDMVLAINEGLKDYVVSLGAPKERTRVLRTGINDELFNPANSDDGSLRKQYGFSGEDIVLFFMGWLYRFSGLKEVARQLIESENRNIKLLIVGEGDSYEELQRIKIEQNLQDRLILTGKKDYSEIPALISAADICILPSYPDEKIMQDIVPIKMYEYMAMQKPVIATRLPGVMKEFGETNGVVYVDRPEDVILKARELIQGDKVAELGLKAREFAARNTWEKVTDEFEEILEETIKRKQA